eukprot:jgi/Ulvmu1/5898/UM026_0019.1
MEKQKTVGVDWGDQQRINSFGKMNHRHQILRASIQDKKQRLEHLDEAQNETMLVDEDDATRYLVGECFLHIGNEDADVRISREMETLQTEMDGLQAEHEELKEKMDSLKSALYNKFGDQINLDDDREN